MHKNEWVLINDFSASSVYQDGSLHSNGNDVAINKIAVRPAMWVDISKMEL